MKHPYLPGLLACLLLAGCTEDKYVFDHYSTMRYDVLRLPTAADTLALRTVDFVSTDVGFAGGDGGTLFATTDAGRTWAVRFRFPQNTIYKLYFSDARTGWAGTNSGLWRTTDGGQTWTSARTYDAYGYTIAVQDIDFVTPQVGYVVGSGGGINKTTNGGLTWQPLNLNRSKTYLLRAVSFSSPTTGMVVGDNVAEWRTTDGGLTWQVYDQYQNSPDTGTTYDLRWQGADSYQKAKITGFVARNPADGYDITDDENYGYPVYGLATSPQGEVVAVGERTIIRQHEEYSQNSGRTPWAYVHAADGTSFTDTYYAADFADAATFYAVGARGIIHRFHYH